MGLLENVKIRQNIVVSYFSLFKYGSTVEYFANTMINNSTSYKVEKLFSLLFLSQKMSFFVFSVKKIVFLSKNEDFLSRPKFDLNKFVLIGDYL